MYRSQSFLLVKIAMAKMTIVKTKRTMTLSFIPGLTSNYFRSNQLAEYQQAARTEDADEAAQAE